MDQIATCQTMDIRNPLSWLDNGSLADAVKEASRGLLCRFLDIVVSILRGYTLYNDRTKNLQHQKKDEIKSVQLREWLASHMNDAEDNGDGSEHFRTLEISNRYFSPSPRFANPWL